MSEQSANQGPVSPQYGITQIDGQPATSISFARSSADEEGARYDLTFRMGSQVVAKAKNLSAQQLEEAVGVKNAKAIHWHVDQAGSLRGEQLEPVDGLTPTEAERRATARQELAAAQQAEAEAAARRAKSPDLVAFEERMKRRGLAPDETRQEIQPEAGQGRREQVVDKDDEGSPPESRRAMELLQARRQAQIEALNKQYLSVGGKYFFKDNAAKLAFEDKGDRIVSAEKDERVAESMAKMAEAKGWSSIRVKGSSDFQREVWLQASVLGIKVHGYAPRDVDLAALQKLQDDRARNSVEQGPPEKVHQQPSPAEVDQQRKRKQSEQDYHMVRPSDHPQADRATVLKAVAASALESTVRSPRVRNQILPVLMKEIDKLAEQGRVPTVQRYDKNAQPRTREPERARAAVERNVERTR